MKLRGSHLIALAILAGIGGWMFTGDIIRGGQIDPDATTIAEREDKRSEDAFRVQVATMQPSERVAELEVRGRTKANATVSVRAETGGTVETQHFNKGQIVAAGDLLCTIEEGVRSTSLAQAETLLNQAQADFDAHQQLTERGFGTNSRLRQLETALLSAKATIAAAQQDMTRTQVRTTIAGIITEPFADAGDNLAPGGVCATVVQTNPIMFTGQISEVDIGTVREGMTSNITLVSGKEASGNISFISPTADERTRTFAVEIEIANPDGTIREGITASARVPLDVTHAYRLLPSWLSLADDGKIGVRVVGKGDIVAFKPIEILAQDVAFIWVNGLNPGDRVITLGQDYVIAGQKVVAVAMDEEALKSAALVSPKQD